MRTDDNTSALQEFATPVAAETTPRSKRKATSELSVVSMLKNRRGRSTISESKKHGRYTSESMILDMVKFFDEMEKKLECNLDAVSKLVE